MEKKINELKAILKLCNLTEDDSSFALKILTDKRINKSEKRELLFLLNNTEKATMLSNMLIRGCAG